MRSVYSDPVEAGLRSGKMFLGIINELEERPLKRQALEQQVEKGKQELDFLPKKRAHEEKMMAEQERQIAQKKQWEADMPHMAAVDSTQTAVAAATEKGEMYNFKPEELASAKYMLKRNAESHGVPFDEKTFDERLQAHRSLYDFLNKHQKDLMKGGSLERGKSKEIDEQLDNLEKVLPYINEGTDKFGESTKTGTVKKVNKIIIDPKTQSFAVQLDIQSPVKGNQKFQLLLDGPAHPYYGKTDAPGMVEKGNIDLSKRPVVGNADGSISTLRTLVIEEDGQHIVIPSITKDGKTLNKEDAIDYYHRQRHGDSHLGKFNNEEDAVAYSEQLHSDPIWQKSKDAYSVAPGTKTRDHKAPLTFGRNSDPNAPVAMVPINIFGASLNTSTSFLNLVDQMRAQNPKFFEEDWKERRGKRKLAEESQPVMDAIDEVLKDPKISAENKQRLTGIRNMVKSGKVPIADAVKLMNEIKPEKKKAETEIELRERAAAGDKEAQKVLDKMKADKKEIKASGKTPKEDKGPTDATIDRRHKQIDTALFSKFKKHSTSLDEKNVDELLDNLPADKQKRVRAIRRGAAYLVEKEGLTAEDAIRQAEKEVDKQSKGK